MTLITDTFEALDTLFDDTAFDGETPHTGSLSYLRPFRRLSHALAREEEVDHAVVSAAGHAFAYDPLARLTGSDCDYDASGLLDLSA